MLNIRKIKRNINNKFEAMNSCIVLNDHEADFLYLVLHYNGIELCEIDMVDNNVLKVVFFATKRQMKKIQKDISSFGITYIGASWAVW